MSSIGQYLFLPVTIFCNVLKENKKLFFKLEFLGYDFTVLFEVHHLLQACSAQKDCVVQHTGFLSPVNCWPSESGNSCDVNIEYELQEESLELNDVIITIPLP